MKVSAYSLAFPKQLTYVLLILHRSEIHGSGIFALHNKLRRRHAALYAGGFAADHIIPVFLDEKSAQKRRQNDALAGSINVSQF